MSTRRGEGDAYEQRLFDILKPVLLNLRPTVGSGSVFGDQDLFSDEFRISVKQRSSTGLTLTELREPYNCEAIGRPRCPLTILRMLTFDPFRAYEIICVDSSFVGLFGRELLVAAAEGLDFDLRILEHWNHGLTRGLIQDMAPNDLLIIHEFPDDDSHSIVLSLNMFLEWVARARELIVA